MSVTFQSIRFGEVEVAEEDVIEFPFGLIGLGGSRYTLLDRNPGTGFLWLHSVDDPALALPVVPPEPVLLGVLAAHGARGRRADRHRGKAADIKLYVTVRATPNPLDITANLRAPLVIHEGRGYQVINANPRGPRLQAAFVRCSRDETTRIAS